LGSQPSAPFALNTTLTKRLVRRIVILFARLRQSSREERRPMPNYWTRSATGLVAPGSLTAIYHSRGRSPVATSTPCLTAVSLTPFPLEDIKSVALIRVLPCVIHHLCVHCSSKTLVFVPINLAWHFQTVLCQPGHLPGSRR
jgi:hypothetical protein